MQWFYVTGGISSNSSPRSRAPTGRRESLVDMAFGNLPWIRRQSSTTSGPSSSAAANSIAAEGDKLRKRRESMTAAFPKRSVKRKKKKMLVCVLTNSRSQCIIRFWEKERKKTATVSIGRRERDGSISIFFFPPVSELMDFFPPFLCVPFDSLDNVILRWSVEQL